MTRRIAVVGNGAAGTLVVTSLLRDATRAGAALDVAWIGDGEPGRGVAYATAHPWHRLNVPADAMTLDEARETFPAWLAARGRDDDPFAPRYDFGTYLVETLDAARTAAAGSVGLTEHRERAVSCHAVGRGCRLGLRSGTVVDADDVVLALGPFPAPFPVPGLDPGADPRVVDDPWDGTLEHVDDGATVLLVGTGLTMVDAALTIARRAPGARMLAVSRGGLLPRDHDPDEGSPAAPAVRPRPGLGLDELVAGVEDAVDVHGGRWREVVDGLRPVTPGLWGALPRSEQRRFLAEQARRWETHRHRMAPSVAAELHALRASGHLRVGDGGLDDARADGPRLRAVRGGSGDVEADLMVACAGAQEDVTAVDDPLVGSLLANGLARPHPLGLGFDTGPHGVLAGSAARVYGIGTLRRGELYETTAIPEIREQALDLAHHLAVPG